MLNNAIALAPAPIPDDVVMIDAAVAAEAFASGYSSTQAEIDASEFAVAGARANGYPDDAVAKEHWTQVLDNRNVERSKSLCEAGDCRSAYQVIRERFPAGTSDADLESSFTYRWRDGIANSPWRGIFAQNLTRTRMFNFYNPDDQVLLVTPGGVNPWRIAQLGQKPYEADDLVRLLWLDLRNTSEDEHLIWGASSVAPSERVRLTRYWAELSYFFQPLSAPAGTFRVPSLEPRNLSMQSVGGAGGLFSGFLSHTYPTGKQAWETKELYRALADVLLASTRASAMSAPE